MFGGREVGLARAGPGRPQLPIELMPADWPRARVRALFAAIRAHTVAELAGYPDLARP